MQHIAIIGGSDAGISAALRAKEIDPDAEITVVVADQYPNFSICGLPFFLSGEVQDWKTLAHRTAADIEGLQSPGSPKNADPPHRRSKHSSHFRRSDYRPYIFRSLKTD